jgi:riboflavin kinase / FMN adenylyltransferase
MHIPGKARAALAAGDLKEANKFLKKIYSVRGIVVRGQQLGRTIGFPTANLDLNEETPLFLANGVYAAKISFGSKFYDGMVNIGIRPTLEQQLLTVEVNIFNFSADIYGKCLKVYFIDRLRDEKKFPGLEELKDQLGRDRDNAGRILTAWNEHNSNPE